MRNPAWRPAQLHSGPLASIQHHFIDARPDIGNNGKYRGKPGITHTLPVCMAIAPGHPAHALQPDYLKDALTRQLNIPASTAVEHGIWQLQAIAPERSTTHAAQGFILVFATADLAGVRLAYTLIKRLSVSSSRRFGVLFSGARDDERVQRCQERLASGARRFLGIGIHELGHLSAPGPEFSAQLACLAEEVQRLCGTQSIHNPLEVAHT